jgi:hypothetical protein
MDGNALLAEACRSFERVTGVEAACRDRGDTTAIRLGAAPPMPVRFVDSVTPDNVDAVIDAAGHGELLVAERVSPRAAEVLRARGVAFLDRAGNAFIQAPELFLFVTGRGAAPRRVTPSQARAFRPKGLQVVFALLCREGLLDAAYREIADCSGVALGTVTGVMRDLEQLGYVRHAGKKRVWLNRAALQDDWAKAYQRELRPRLQPRRYRVAATDWWREVDVLAHGFRLGGEAAAARLTGYLEPGEVTLYGDGDFRALARLIRPERDDAGNLEVLPSFWQFTLEPDLGPVVPPLLVYADLLASPADRVREVAGLVREQYLG